MNLTRKPPSVLYQCRGLVGWLGGWLEVCLLRGFGKGNELSGGTGLLHRRVGHYTERREGQGMEGESEGSVEMTEWKEWRVEEGEGDGERESYEPVV